MPPVGFESTVSAGEWPQTYALDRPVTGTSIKTDRNEIKLKGASQSRRNGQSM